MKKLFVCVLVLTSITAHPMQVPDLAILNSPDPDVFDVGFHGDLRIKISSLAELKNHCVHTVTLLGIQEVRPCYFGYQDVRYLQVDSYNAAVFKTALDAGSPIKIDGLEQPVLMVDGAVEIDGTFIQVFKQILDFKLRLLTGMWREVERSQECVTFTRCLNVESHTKLMRALLVCLGFNDLKTTCLWKDNTIVVKVSALEAERFKKVFG